MSDSTEVERTAPQRALHRDALCQAWARNAMVGAMYALRGCQRRLIPVADSQLREIPWQGTLSSLEGIPVPAQEYVRDSGRNFLEDSVFFGYDYMRHLPKEQLLEFFGNSFIIFTEAYQLKYCKQIPHSASGNR
jgi:hypothetical protein